MAGRLYAILMARTDQSLSWRKSWSNRWWNSRFNFARCFTFKQCAFSPACHATTSTITLQNVGLLCWWTDVDHAAYFWHMAASEAPELHKQSKQTFHQFTRHTILSPLPQPKLVIYLVTPTCNTARHLVVSVDIAWCRHNIIRVPRTSYSSVHLTWQVRWTEL